MYKYVKEAAGLPQTIQEQDLNDAIIKVDQQRHDSENEDKSDEEGLYCELCRVFFDDAETHSKRQRHQRLQKKFFYDYHRFLKKAKGELIGKRFLFHRCSRFKKLKFLNKLYTFAPDN